MMRPVLVVVIVTVIMIKIMKVVIDEKIIEGLPEKDRVGRVTGTTGIFFRPDGNDE